MKKRTGYEYYTNRHSCFLLQYHIVLVTKYRHPVLTGDVKTAVYERINYVAESRRNRCMPDRGACKTWRAHKACMGSQRTGHGRGTGTCAA